jgi:hypothetical protein
VLNREALIATTIANPPTSSRFFPRNLRFLKMKRDHCGCGFVSERCLLRVAAVVAILVLTCQFLNNVWPLVTTQMTNDGDCLLSSMIKDSTTNDDLRSLISSAEQIIILMPAKAAGTSFKAFASKCATKTFNGNFLNFKDRNDFDSVLTASYDVPAVLASHMYQAENLIYFIKNAPRNTLLIYSHRDETTRLLSAIDHVVTSWCQGIRSPPEGFFEREQDDNAGLKECFVSEKSLINLGINRKVMEIGIGATCLLTCETYKAIRDYGTKL